MTERLNRQFLPDGWVWTDLSSIVINHDGRRIPVRKSDREAVQGQYPYYGASGIIDYVNDYLFDGEYLLLAEDGANLLSRSTPIAFRASGKFWVNNHAHILTTKGSIPQSYLEYYFAGLDLSPFVTGTAQPKLTQRNMNYIQVPLAPLNEQHRIVAAIETQFTRLDAAVTALQRSQANLKRYRAAVLKAACEGRLVPTEAALAQAEGRSYEPAAVLLQRILAERRHKWEAENPKKKYQEPVAPDTSALPELPEGWCWAKVKDVGRVQLGRQRAPQYHSGPYMRPYLRVANVFEDHIDISDVLEMNFEPTEFEKYRLKYGDILLNEGQSPQYLGRPAMFRDEIQNACFQNTLIRFEAHDCLDPGYALIQFRSYMHTRRFMDESQITTNIAHLSVGRFSEIEFPLPPLAEQHRIVAEVERRLSLIDQLEKTIKTDLARANRLRQSILKRAFAGQLVPQDPNDEPAAVLLARLP